MVRGGSIADDKIHRDDIIDALGDDNFIGDQYNTEVFMPTLTSRSLKSIVRRLDSPSSNEGTLISRQWHYVMPISLLLYVVLQVSLSTQSSVCDLPIPFADWTYLVGIAVASCFGLSVCYHVSNGLSVESWAQKETEHLRGVYAGAATMSIIAGSSTVLYLSRFGTHVCRDALGMDTPGVQWPEWMVAAPLLVYITIAIEDKSELTVEDYAIIILMFLCILFGFVMNFFEDLAWGIILYILSTLCMVGNIVLALKAKQDTKNQENSKLLSRQWILERKIMKSRLAQLLFWILPLFPIFYIFGIVQIIDRDEVVVVNMLIGLMVKLFFVSTLSLESVVMQFAAERKVNDRRRQFLRYVFHEVRVPLNTITMGISVLKDDVSQEVVAMMDAAAGFMSNTLNDVLSMSKIEDGSISLVMRAFALTTLLESSIKAVRTLATAKAVRIAVKGLSPKDDARGLTLLGDENRLQHVLVNFLSNAVKFSISGSVVNIEVGSAVKKVPRRPSDAASVYSSVRSSAANSRKMSRFSRRNRINTTPSVPTAISKDQEIRFVTVIVNDLGVGIPEDDHAKLFQAFAQIRPHDLEGMVGRGSGVGLVMAKEIITLHKGEVLFKSQVGIGSSFGFTIPFVVVGSTNISVKAVSQFVHPTFNQFSRMKRKITIPSMSMRLLPLKNRLLTRSRVSTVSNCVITKNSTETTMDRREKEERERERKKRKSESFALPFMVQTCNGSYSHTGIPHVQNEGPDGCNGPGNGEAVGEILLSEHEEDDRSGFGSHIDVPPEDPFRPRTENTMWKGREDADGDGEIEGNIEEREACTLISDIDADSYKCGVANPPLDMRASSLSATSRRRVSSTISEPFATSGSVFEGYTERKMTFLLVDDTVSNCKMLKMLLNKKGIDCDMASNGLEAVTAYKAAFTDGGARRAAMYEVIFMDYTMPVMNGLEACTIIRSLGFTGLIVGVTGNALDDDVANFIRAGADCVFAKPFREEHLAALLQFISENGCESSIMSQTLIKPEQKKYFL